MHPVHVESAPSTVTVDYGRMYHQGGVEVEVGGTLLDVGVAMVAVQEQMTVGGVGEQSLGARAAEASVRTLRRCQQTCKYDTALSEDRYCRNRPANSTNGAIS